LRNTSACDGSRAAAKKLSRFKELTKKAQIQSAAGGAFRLDRKTFDFRRRPAGISLAVAA
jgi:uncharacterized protein YjhX (UPF0386 family)